MSTENRSRGRQHEKRVREKLQNKSTRGSFVYLRYFGSKTINEEGVRERRNVRWRKRKTGRRVMEGRRGTKGEKN